MSDIPIRDQAIQRLKSTLSLRPIIALHRDYQIQSLAAVWEFVQIDEQRAAKIPAGGTVRDMGPKELISTAWDGMQVDLGGLRDLLGPAFPAAQVLTRAKLLGLVYPDNTVHKNAENWLAVAAVNATKDMMESLKQGKS